MSDKTDKILFRIMTIFFVLALIFGCIYKFISENKIFSIISTTCLVIWLILFIIELTIGIKMLRDESKKKK